MEGCTSEVALHSRLRATQLSHWSTGQELYFLEDTATPILQTDASDYGIGGYMYMVTNGQVRVIRFFSEALVGAQLNWSAREKECYAIFYGVRLFEDLF